MEQHSAGEPIKMKKFQPLVPKNDKAPKGATTIKSKVVKPKQVPKPLVSKFLSAVSPLREVTNAVSIEAPAMQTEAVGLTVEKEVVGTRQWSANKIVGQVDRDAEGNTEHDHEKSESAGQRGFEQRSVEDLGKARSSDTQQIKERSRAGPKEMKENYATHSRVPERGDFLVHRLYADKNIVEDNFVLQVTSKPKHAKGNYMLRFRSVSPNEMSKGRLDITLSAYGDAWRFASHAEVLAAEEERRQAKKVEAAAPALGNADEAGLGPKDQALTLPEMGGFAGLLSDKSIDRGFELTSNGRDMKGGKQYRHRLVSTQGDGESALELLLAESGGCCRVAREAEVGPARARVHAEEAEEKDEQSDQCEDDEPYSLERRLPAKGDYLVYRKRQSAKLEEANFVCIITGQCIKKRRQGLHSYEFQYISACEQDRGGFELKLDHYGDRWRFATRAEVRAAHRERRRVMCPEVTEKAKPPIISKAIEGSSTKWSNSSAQRCQDEAANRNPSAIYNDALIMAFRDGESVAARVLAFRSDEATTVEWLADGIVEDVFLKEVRFASPLEAHDPNLNDASRFPPRKGDYLVTLDHNATGVLARVDRDCKEPEPGLSHAAVCMVDRGSDVLTLKSAEYGLAWRYATNAEIANRLRDNLPNRDNPGCRRCGAATPKVYLNCHACRKYVICGCCNDPPLEVSPPAWYCPDCGWASGDDT